MASKILVLVLELGMSEMVERVARKEAPRLGLGRYFTGKPCRRGHIAARFVGNRECVPCALLRSEVDPKKAARAKASARRNQAVRTLRTKEAYWNDPAAAQAYHRDWRAKNRDRLRVVEARRRVKNRAQQVAYARLRYLENKEAVRAATVKWERANPHKVAARTARRRAAKLRATPLWADELAITAHYGEARRLTAFTGVLHEVDHIVPLQGAEVCGLHVEYNLQILTKSANSSKKNRLMIDKAPG